MDSAPIPSVALTDINRRYRTMETAANRLQREAKGYLDALRGGFAYSLWARGMTDHD